MNLGKIEALLSPAEQVPTEQYTMNQRIKVYVLEVKNTPKGPQVLVSRTHPELVKRLFEQEVRRYMTASYRSRALPESRVQDQDRGSQQRSQVDPLGACVGPNGEPS